MKSAMLLLALVATGAVEAREIPECQVRVLRPVTDDMGNHWSAGKLLPATIMRRGPNGLSFCVHGGSCVPRMNGGQQAGVLVNCHPGPAIGGGDYSLVPDEAVMGREGARRFRSADVVDKRLAALGFSNAAAAQWASDYVQRPTSTNGQLVEKALEGSAAAIATMKAKLP